MMMGVIASKRAFVVGVHLLRPLYFASNTSSRYAFSSSAIDRICTLLDSQKTEVSIENNRTLESVSKRLSQEYEHLPPLETTPKENQMRRQILDLLSSELGTHHEAILEAAQNYTATAQNIDLPVQRVQLATKLREACTPKYNEMFRMVLAENAQVGIRFFVQLRQDLLRYIDFCSARDERHLSLLKQLDSSLRSLLATWFSSEALEIRRITYETTSAAIIETIATKEAVHPLQSLDDLRARLGPDKRVFCAFHPLLPEEPLIFVHVALRNFIPDAMDQVMDTSVMDHATVATFYSISSTQPGLSGVDLGHILIKKATALLQQELPSLKTFVTLSPLPKFRLWLRDKLVALNQGGTFFDPNFLSELDLEMLRSALNANEDVAAQFLKALEHPWTLMSSHSHMLEPILMKLAARYLVLEKHRRKPLDGVARFHIQNGAEMYRLNFMADKSRKGIHNSLGLMVNYRYSLDNVDSNRQQHAVDSTVPVHESVTRWLQ
jgi:malonyl-CoA decarboxylase